MAAFSLFILIIITAYIFVMCSAGIWVYKDAKKKGLPTAMWAAVAALTPGFVGLLLYIVYRADKKPLMLCKACGRSIELNVSFCPYCGYQSPPIEAAYRPERASKKLLALIFIPVALMFAGLSVIIGIASLSPNNEYMFKTNITAYTDYTDYTGYAKPDRYGDNWDSSSYYIRIGGITESYEKGNFYYSNPKQEGGADIFLTYIIPENAREITIEYQFTGNAKFNIWPEPEILPKSSQTSRGNNNETQGVQVFDASDFAQANEGILEFHLYSYGEPVYDIKVNVNATTYSLK
jgi:hypothetical protein